jgi:thiamine biosynthesis protein ThiI
MTLFVVHYSEIALKGKNRPRFIEALARNIKKLSAYNAKVERHQGRLIVEGEEKMLEDVLQKTFGVAWFAPVESVPLEYSLIEKATLRVASSKNARTFAIITKRANKRFPMTSMELSSKLGKTVSMETSMRVELKNPELNIYVEVLEDSALIYSNKKKGAGGLPVGVSGLVIHLLSGGIDSPVAAYMMMKRGSLPIYMHFYSYPDSKEVLNTKIAEQIRLLSNYGGGRLCVLVPFAKYQLATMSSAYSLEPTLFRYFMRLTAEKAAEIFGAKGISTGDSLSQAASQTIWNIRAMDFLSSYPIFRPLLSYDKEEIVEIAKRIGTYNSSISEYKDCCSIISRHPKTRVSVEELVEASKNLGLDSLSKKILADSSLLLYSRRKDTFSLVSLEEYLTRNLARKVRPLVREGREGRREEGRGGGGDE